MAQQLNLYDRDLRPVRQWLTPGRLALALLGLLALMASAATWLQRDAARWRVQAAADEAQLQQLASAQQQMQLAADTELPRLREQLAQARLLAEALQTEGPRDQAARVFAGLSNAAQPGVWIDIAQWQASPRQLALEGGLLQASQLPAYLRRLERQPAFDGQRFEQLQLRPADGAALAVPHHRFVLRSQAREGSR